jgi:SAM-dependent methyltransferase
MGSVTNSFFRFFRSAAPAAAPAASPPQQRATRRSSGLNELMREVVRQPALCILDLGPTSPTNIAHLTGLGHKVYNEDLLSASVDPAYACRTAEGKPAVDVAHFIAENLTYEKELFDAVLCWDVADYLHESLVKPVIERLHSAMKPGGVVLAFFHTRDAGPDALYYRYHIAGNDSLTLQPVTARDAGRTPLFRLQRIFNNRHIENLFHDYASLKFFLARDNVREVLVVR